MFLAFFVTVVVAAVSLVVWYYQSHSKLRGIIDKIPGPPAVPLFGNALQLKTDGAEFFAQLCGFSEKYGRKKGVFRIWLGTHPIVYFVSADSVECLLNSSKHMSKSTTYRLLHPWLGTGLLTSTGAKWHARRKQLTPTFHFKILNDFQVVFNEQAEVLINKVDEKAGKGTFDIFPYITLCALDIICETAMGCSVNAQENSDSEYVNAIYKISELIQMRFKKPWLGSDMIFNQLPAGRQHQKYLNILQGFTRKVIEERHAELEKLLSKTEQRSKESSTLSEEDIDDQKKLFAKQGKKRLAFLDMLLYSARGENGMTFDDIQEEVDTFMFEGHDTTAAAMNWACYLIGKHPDVQERLQEEVDAVIGQEVRPLTGDDVKQLKYLECVVKEALRLYPSVPQFGREISEDTNIVGYDIPKGATAFLLTFSLHRDPRHFPNPEKFDPDRWTVENSSSRHPYCYVPFSAGLRNCIGQRFAMMEEKTLLAYLIHKFHITSKQNKDELTPVGELILRPENGILVELQRRR